MIRSRKGDESRMVLVGASGLQRIEAYLERPRLHLLVDPVEQALCLSGYGKRMSATYVGNWITKTAKAAEIGKRGSCHLFRHSCTTHIVVSGRAPASFSSFSTAPGPTPP